MDGAPAVFRLTESDRQNPRLRVDDEMIERGDVFMLEMSNERNRPNFSQYNAPFGINQSNFPTVRENDGPAVLQILGHLIVK